MTLASGPLEKGWLQHFLLAVPRSPSTGAVVPVRGVDGVVADSRLTDAA